MQESNSRAGVRVFGIHCALYVLVMAALAAADLTQMPDAGGPRAHWFQWPLLGWGIGVAAHGLALLLRARARDGNLLADAEIRAVAVHLFVYVAINALLIAVNLVETPDSVWFVWPLLGWGAGFALHAWLAYRAVLRRTAEQYATEQRILSEIQLERLAAEIASAVAPIEEVEPEPVRRRGRKKTAASKAKRPVKKRAAAARKPSARRRRAAAKAQQD